MKYLASFFCLLVVISQTLAQAPPQLINYQAIARDGSGEALPNQSVSFQFSILDNGMTPIYVEQHNGVVTNDFGLVNLNLGGGAVQMGTFAAIDWSGGMHFLKIDIDPAGGTNFIISDTQKLLSVPYAFYAASAAAGGPGSNGWMDDGSVVRLITSSDEVGIGTSTPSAKVHIYQPSTDDALRVDDVINDTTPFVIDADGNVGVGSSTPSAKLDIIGDSELNGDVDINSDLDVDGGTFHVDGDADRVGVKTTNPIAQFDVAGEIAATTNDARLRLMRETGANYLDVEDSNDFFIRSINIDDTNANTRMTIKNSGEVGVGTTSPIAHLDVAGEIAATTNDARLRLMRETGANYLDIEDSNDFFIRSINIDDTNANTRMTIDNSGDVGINTTTPSAQLDVVGNTELNGDVDINSDLDVDAGTFHVDGTADEVGVGTATPSAKFHIFQPAAVDALRVDDVINDTTPFVIDQNGNVGIGISSPTAQLHSLGSVRFATFGAGTLQTDASGNLSVSSDINLKEEVESYVRGISEIVQIDPIKYKWRKESGLDTKNEYTGFNAQNVQEVIPEAVNVNRRGYLTLSDRPIIAALVNSVKELKAENDQLRNELKEIKEIIEKNVAGNQE